MADKTIQELPQASALTGNELILLEQNAEAKKASSSAFTNKVAEQIVSASGFQQKLDQSVSEYFDNDPPFFELPSGGQSGQALLSDGADGAVWGEAGIPDAVKTALIACFQNVAWKDEQSGQIYIDALEEALADEEITPTPTPTPSDDTIIPGKLTLSNVVANQYIDENGDVQSYQGSYYNDAFFQVTPGVEYFITCNSNNFRISEYSQNNTFIKQTQIQHATSLESFVFSEQTHYFKFGWYNGNSATPPNIEVYYFAASLPMQIGDVDATTGADNPNQTLRIHSDFLRMSDAVSVSGWPFSNRGNLGGIAFRCYNSQKSFIGSLLDNGNFFTADFENAVLPTGTAYVKLFMQKGTGNADQFSSGWSSSVVSPLAINGTTYRLTEASS